MNFQCVYSIALLTGRIMLLFRANISVGIPVRAAKIVLLQ